MAIFPDVKLYDNTATTVDGAVHSLYELDAYRVDMIQSGQALATTGDVAENNDFTVKWLATGRTGE